MKFLIFVFLLIALLNVNALSKNRLSNAMTIREADPPNTDDQTSLLEEESSSFELFNFYEYTFYVESYELYNAYALNTGLSCSSTKKAFWYQKKLDAQSTANFCNLIGSKISSSYLSSYLCGYISGTVNWFNSCSY